MKQSRFSEEQIISILKQQEGGRTTVEVCREAGIEAGISAATFYAWKAKFGGMSVSEAQRLRQLESEHRSRSSHRHRGFEGCDVKKMVTPSLKKEAAGYLQEQHGLSQRKAAHLVKSAPRVLRYPSKRPDDGALRCPANTLARTGQRASPLWLPQASCVTAARGRGDQPQKDTPPLP